MAPCNNATKTAGIVRGPQQSQPAVNHSARRVTEEGSVLLRAVQSIVHFVPDIASAARWYADLLSAEVEFENSMYAFVRGPKGILLGFHPADAKCPSGPGGVTAYWEVDDLERALRHLESRGAKLYRGPMRTSCGALAAMLVDPFGCTFGLNQSTVHSSAESGFQSFATSTEVKR